MKIAFLNIYNGAVERGSEVFVHELAERLAASCDVHVYQTGNISVKKYNIKKISGISFHPHQKYLSFSSKIMKFINSQVYHFLVLFFTLRCLPHLWREKYDWLIPVNGRFQTVLCRLIRFFRGGKILITGHAGVGFEDRFNIVFGKPDVFVALNPKAYTWATKIRPDVYYIPNGVDTRSFNPKVSPRELPIGKPIVMCVSALLSYKRVDLLIKVVSKVSNASLLLIGDGPERKKILELGARLLGNKFHWIPSVKHGEISHYYTASSIFSLPSEESEAFGLVYLEAMACNLPVVVPDDENRRGIVAKAGFYFSPNDVDSYKEALEKALNHDFGNLPRTRAEKFSWEDMTKKYEEIIAKA